MKRGFTSIVLLLIASFAFSQTDSAFDTYYSDLETQFKKENGWYRTWNRYEVNPGFAKYSIGPSLNIPSASWSDVKNNWGIRYHRSHFEASYAQWDGQEVRDGDSLFSYKRFSMGYFTPINKLRIGTRVMGVKGIRIQPVFGLGYANDAGNPGLYSSPGFHFQLPFLIIDTRLNFNYTLNRGFSMVPEVSLRLDALWDLLDPTRVKTGTYTHTSTSATPIGGGWYKVSSTRNTSDFSMKDIGPFWGITPRVGYSPSKTGQDKFINYGLGITGRLGFLGADVYYNNSKMITSTTNHESVDEKVKKTFDNKEVIGLVNTREVGVEGVVNIIGLVLGVLKPETLTGDNGLTTPLNRLNFHLGVVHQTPSGVTYENPSNATNYSNNFFNSYPDIKRDAINDPLIQEKGWGVTYGISYEMGSVGIRFNNRINKTIGNSNTLDFYYILPITKVIKAYKK